MPSPTQSATAEQDQNSAQWLRILPLVFFALIASFVLFASFFMAIVQFIVAVVQDEPNRQLRDFGARVGAYLGELVNYLIYNTDQMPFPFATFPGEPTPPVPAASAAPAAAKPKAKPRKTAKTTRTTRTAKKTTKEQ